MTTSDPKALPLTDGHQLIDPSGYDQTGHPHSLWTELRETSPVHRCEPEGYEPFWAITRHADIREISKNPGLFLSSDGIVLIPSAQRLERDEGLGAMRTIIEMDPPEHRTFRKVGSPWFTPNALARIDSVVEQSAKEIVDKLAGKSGEGECDFAMEVANAHPLRILCQILGVDRKDEPYVLRMTNELFAGDDPDLQREGDDRLKAIQELGMEFFQFFNTIIEDRRATPRDDLATVLATAQVDGAAMGPMETFGYYLITFTAGHDTTKNAIAGGMDALIDNPGELEKVKNDLSLIEPLFEEIVRWTTPVNYMMRTLAKDIEFKGQKMREGDRAILFYASANRDESVFEEPFRFKADRRPNPHLGFGYGEHFCLGANLARRSARALFREILSRLQSVEKLEEPSWIRSSFVVGLKKLPIRYRFAVDA